MSTTMQANLELYQAERIDLIQKDRALRIDYARTNLTSSEAKADQIVRSIRAAEASSIWSVEHDSIPHPFPGMEFLTGKDSCCSKFVS
jgi:adenosine deaminase CECR1